MRLSPSPPSPFSVLKITIAWFLAPVLALGQHSNGCCFELVGASGRLGSLFLQKQGAVAVPRGIAPGCLSSPESPIIVTVPAKSWRTIAECTTSASSEQDASHSSRTDDLVYVGNGILDEDLHRNATVVLPHFGVLKVHGPVVTSPNSPPSYVYGKHATFVADFLANEHNIKVQRITSWATIRTLAARKLLWATCLWLLCHDTGNDDTPLTLAQVHAQRHEELKSLVYQLLPRFQQLTDDDNNDINMDVLHEEIVDYMEAYSLSMPDAIPSKSLAMAELRDRNGVFLTRNQTLHVQLLERVVGKEIVESLLSQQNYAESEQSSPPQMMQLGNSLNIVCLGQNGDRDASPPRSIIVIGGGIVGSSVALNLATSSCRQVTVFDPTEVGLTTPASWAWLNANQKSPFSYQQLNHLGMLLWKTSEDWKTAGASWPGSLVRVKEPLTVGFEKNVWGPLNQQQIRDLEPLADFNDSDASSSYVYHFPDEGFVDPSHAVKAIRRMACERSNVQFLRQSVTSLIRDHKNKVIGVRTDDDLTHYADLIIVAAGIRSPDFGKVPLVHSPGCIAFAEPAKASSPKRLTRILVDMVRESHVLQRQDSAFVIGGGALEVGGTSGTAIRATTSPSSINQQLHASRLLSTASELLPSVQLRPQQGQQQEAGLVRMAIRPMPLDGLPIVGYLEERLYAVVTHSGMTLAPILGALVAREVSSNPQTTLDILNPYRPTRFQ